MAASERPEGRTTELERLIFFSDAVFAIAITLLVIDIKVPEIPEGQGATELVNTELVNRVRDLYPNILSYVISFLVIASYWLAHHRLFSHIRRYDRRLLWLNLYFLMFIAFLPFPTGILGRYGDTFFATAFYVAFQVVIGLLLALLWAHATRDHRLVDPDLDSRIIRGQTVRLLIMPIIFALSIGVAAFNPDAGKYFWILLLVARPVVGRIMRDVPDDD